MSKLSDKEINEAIHDACLKSAIAMGARIRELSWFSRNHPHIKRNKD